MDSEHKKKYQAYITSEEWYNLKIDLIQIRGNRCEKCGKKKSLKYLHIHHITYERLFNEKAQDLLILCAYCHAKEHGIIKVKVKLKHPKKKKKKSKGGYKERFLTVERKWKEGYYKSAGAYLQARKSLENIKHWK